jgi:hypothetical protein
MKSQKSNAKPEIEHKTLIDPLTKGKLILTRVRVGETVTMSLWDPNEVHTPAVFDDNAALETLWGMPHKPVSSSAVKIITPRNWNGSTDELGIGSAADGNGESAFQIESGIPIPPARTKKATKDLHAKLFPPRS